MEETRTEQGNDRAKESKQEGCCLGDGNKPDPETKKSAPAYISYGIKSLIKDLCSIALQLNVTNRSTLQVTADLLTQYATMKTDLASARDSILMLRKALEEARAQVQELKNRPPFQWLIDENCIMHARIRELEARPAQAQKVTVLMGSKRFELFDD